MISLNKVMALSLAFVTVAVISGAAGYWIAGQQREHADTPGSAAPTMTPPEKIQSKERVLYWYDPMVPNQHFDKPGKSPFMDMQLVAMHADDDTHGQGAASVRIDPATVQNLGIRWATAERGTLATPISATATVLLNDRQVAIIQARSAGFVERVYARAPGDVLAAGAPLADLLIPDWAGAQSEFLAMLNTNDAALIQAARQRLNLLGMGADLIDQVEKTRHTAPVVSIRTPIAGLLQSLDVRVGMAVSAGAPLAKINGLDTVWLEAAIPQAQGGMVTTGANVTAMLTAYPGESFNGKVITILPETNAETRTLRVRVELPNHGNRLKPGMFAQIRLDAGAGAGASALLIPSEAVIRTGTRNIVFIARDHSHFQPVEVKLGQEADGQVAVLEGLSEGQKIVASGQFLIDSEAGFKGVMARQVPAGSSHD